MKCKICGMLYADDGDSVHTLYHHKFLACGLRLAHYPETYEEREQRKSFGYKLISESTQLHDQVFGAMQVITAWFERSLSDAINEEYWTEHPTFEEYAGMIDDELFPLEIQQVITRRFGNTPGILDDGNYWRPPQKQCKCP